MPRKSKKQIRTQQIWMDKIARARKVRSSWRDLMKVDEAREYLDGKQNPGVEEADWITINNFYSYLKAQLPSLYSQDPYFYVRLKRSYKPFRDAIDEMQRKGKIRTAYLNYLKDELDMKTKARLSIQDAQTSYGVLKVHHSSDMTDNPAAGEPILNEAGSEPLVDDAGQFLLEPEIIPVNARYNINRVHPDDFLWDEDAGTLEDTWNWIAQRIRQPLNELKKDRRFSKIAIKSLQGKGETKGDEEKHREDRKKGGDIKGRSERDNRKVQPIPEPDIISRWEIYNIKEKTWIVIAEEGEIPLMDEQSIPIGMERHPFAVLRFTYRDDSPYPIPPFSQGLDVCKEYNKARSDIQKHRKRFNRKYEVYEMAFDDADAEMSKLESGDDGTILRKKSPEQAVFPVQDLQLDQMRYQELSYLKMEMNDLFGMNTGETNQIARADSATQAGILDRRLEVKEGDAVSMVLDWIVIVARKLDQLVQVHIEQDEAIAISGPMGEGFQTVKTTDYEQIEGEYSYSVNVGSTLPRMPQIERASWMAFLGLLAQFPHLLLSQRMFRKMAELHHLDDEIMLEEMFMIGQQIMSGQLPYPGGGGSQPGVGEDRPVSAMGGMQGGAQSLTKGNASIAS